MLKNKRKRLKTYRRIMYGVLIIANIISFFHRASVGTLKIDLMNEFNMSPVKYANLSSIFFYIYMIMQIPSGVLADTVGPRKTIFSGILLAGIGTVLFGIARSIIQIFLGRLLIGLGISVVYICIVKLLSRWYMETEFGSIIGLTASLGNLGGVLAQTPLVLLLGVLTWRNAYIVIGLFTILVSFLAYFIIRNKPSDMGLSTIEEIDDKAKADNFNNKVNLLDSIKSVLKNKYSWILFFIFAGFYGAFSTLTGTWGTSYIIDVYNIPMMVATNYIMIAIIGHIIGATIIGNISDKFKSRKIPMRIFGVIYLISWALIVFWDGGKAPIEALKIILFLLGFASGSFLLVLSSAKEINSRDVVGVSTSIVNTGGFLGAAIMPPVVGCIIEKLQYKATPTTTYQSAFMCCFIVVLIGNVLVMFMKETNCRNIYQEIKKDSMKIDS